MCRNDVGEIFRRNGYTNRRSGCATDRSGIQREGAVATAAATVARADRNRTIIGRHLNRLLRNVGHFDRGRGTGETDGRTLPGRTGEVKANLEENRSVRQVDAIRQILLTRDGPANADLSGGIRIEVSRRKSGEVDVLNIGKTQHRSIVPQTELRGDDVGKIFRRNGYTDRRATGTTDRSRIERERAVAATAAVATAADVDASCIGKDRRDGLSVAVGHFYGSCIAGHIDDARLAGSADQIEADLEQLIAIRQTDRIIRLPAKSELAVSDVAEIIDRQAGQVEALDVVEVQYGGIVTDRELRRNDVGKIGRCDGHADHRVTDTRSGTDRKGQVAGSAAATTTAATVGDRDLTVVGQYGADGLCVGIRNFDAGRIAGHR